jgi:hypothetical protein
MMAHVPPILIMGGRFIVIIERQHLFLLVRPAQDVGRVTIFSLVKLFEKPKLVGNAIIVARIETQAEPLRQFRQSLAPFGCLDVAVNHANNGDDGKRDEHQDHAASVCQGKWAGYYKLTAFLERLYNVRRKSNVAMPMASTVKQLRKSKSPLTAISPVFFKMSSLNPCTA